MIVGGGIGNMIDRVWLGYVVDFIDFRLINFAIFNVADSFVTVGAGIMMVYLISDMIKKTKKEQQKKAELAAKDAEDDAGDDPSEDA
jgi:signal peptidase II